MCFVNRCKFPLFGLQMRVRSHQNSASTVAVDGWTTMSFKDTPASILKSKLLFGPLLYLKYEVNAFLKFSISIVATVSSSITLRFQQLLTHSVMACWVPEGLFWAFVKKGDHLDANFLKIISGNFFDHEEDTLGIILSPISGLQDNQLRFYGYFCRKSHFFGQKWQFLKVLKTFLANFCQ